MGRRHLERAQSVLFLSGYSGGPRKVVLDGANIAHGGANGSGLDGRRVISAISEYKSKGYEVITVFKKETYNFMAKNKKPGFNKLKRLKEKNEMTLFKKNDDHLAIVLAIKHNAWLITQDTFKSHKTGPRERELRPEWFQDGKLDALTRGTSMQSDGWVSSGHHWEITDDYQFVDPNIPSVKQASSFTKLEEVAISALEIEKDIQQLHLTVDEIESFGLSKQHPNFHKQPMRMTLGNARAEIRKFIDLIPDEARFKLSDKEITKNLMVGGIKDLRQICKNRGISNYTGKNKEHLSELIRNDIKNRGLYVHYDSSKTIFILREKVEIGTKNSIQIMKEVNNALVGVENEEYAYWHPGA